MLARPVVGHDVKEVMRSLLPLGIDLTGLEMDTAVAAYLLDASTGEYELSQLREQTGQLTLDIVEPGDRRRATWPRRRPARRPTSPAWRRASAGASRTEDMVMLHDDIETPARPGPGQDGGGRHRRRPGRAAGDRRLAQGVGGHAPGRGAGAAPATSST